jgi:signal peptidase I
VAHETAVRLPADDLRPPPRGIVGVLLIGFLLGSVVLMLWLGRWKLALVYFVVGIAVAALVFLGSIHGVIPRFLLTGVRSTFDIVIYPVTFVGLIHGLLLRGSARDRPWYSRWYVALPVLPIAAFLVAVGVRTYLLQPFNAPSLSNVPNLMLGDYFFVSKRAYSTGRPPRRGDIAVFKLPRDGVTDYVKRVVGLPGERIRMIGGVLHIDGTPVKLEPVELPPEFREGDYEGLSYSRETLPEGRSYVIANEQDNGDADNTEEFVVPPGRYFVMGDNRDNSADSRFPENFGVGFVPEENFVGRYAFRFWNDRGFRFDNRPEETYAKN